MSDNAEERHRAVHVSMGDYGVASRYREIRAPEGVG